MENAPSLLLQDPLLAAIFQAGIAGLSINEPHALGAILSFYRKLVELSSKSAAVVTLFKEYGGNLTAVLFNGLVDFYSQDSISDVAALFKSLAEMLPSETSQWTMSVLNAVPEEYMSMEIKSDFMANWTG